MARPTTYYTFGGKLLKALGIDSGRPVKAVTIRCAVGEVVRVTIEEALEAGPGEEIVELVRAEGDGIHVVYAADNP